MKVLLTGASGFLGKAILQMLGKDLEIETLGRSELCQHQVDLGKSIPIFANPFDLVIHASGKAHQLPKDKNQIEEMFQVNEIGTKNLCTGLENSNKIPNTLVFISTVAVYGAESGEMIKEINSLNGSTPYALSKIHAEQYLIDWSKTNHVNLVILRLPLIVGINPPGNLGAMMRAIHKGYYFRIGKGEGRKSMVLANDIASIIPSLMGKSGIYNLTDGKHPSISELDNYLGRYFSKRIVSLPENLLKVIAFVGDCIPGFPFNTNKYNKLNATLTFDDNLARRNLGWNPRPVIGNIF